MKFEITKGVQKKAQKIVLYGAEGIGKTTFAAAAPDPLFIDTEEGTGHLDVKRLPKPDRWETLIEEIQYAAKDPSVCDTLVVDTLDWAERLCTKYICTENRKKGIEDFGYGKGYTYLKEEFSKMLSELDTCVNNGINVICTAHAMMRKFEQPDEQGAYDRWELKLSKQVSPLVKEWGDALLFANYKTTVKEGDSGKMKASGGARVLYANHHACWDAKNRWGLPDENRFEFKTVSKFVPSKEETATSVAQAKAEKSKAFQKEAEQILDEDLIDEKTQKELVATAKELFDESVLNESVIAVLKKFGRKKIKELKADEAETFKKSMKAYKKQMNAENLPDGDLPFDV